MGEEQRFPQSRKRLIVGAILWTCIIASVIFAILGLTTYQFLFVWLAVVPLFGVTFILIIIALLVAIIRRKVAQSEEQQASR